MKWSKRALFQPTLLTKASRSLIPNRSSSRQCKTLQPSIRWHMKTRRTSRESSRPLTKTRVANLLQVSSRRASELTLKWSLMIRSSVTSVRKSTRIKTSRSTSMSFLALYRLLQSRWPTKSSRKPLITTTQTEMASCQSMKLSGLLTTEMNNKLIRSWNRLIRTKMVSFSLRSS